MESAGNTTKIEQPLIFRPHQHRYLNTQDIASNNKDKQMRTIRKKNIDFTVLKTTSQQNQTHKMTINRDVKIMQPTSRMKISQLYREEKTANKKDKKKYITVSALNADSFETPVKRIQQEQASHDALKSNRRDPFISQIQQEKEEEDKQCGCIINQNNQKQNQRTLNTHSKQLSNRPLSSNNSEMYIETELRIIGGDSVLNNAEQMPIKGNSQIYQSNPDHELNHKPKINLTLANGQTECIAQQFRYCIGCQKAVLQANMNFHQQTCLYFIAMFQKQPQQLIEAINLKIVAIHKRICELYINQFASENQLIDKYRNFLCYNFDNAEPICFSQNFVSEFSKLMKECSNWCSFSQEMSRLKWFMKIRERIQDEFGI